MTPLGELALWVAVVMSAWATITTIVGGARSNALLVQSGERATGVVLLFLLVASASLWTALVTRDFSVAYVAYNTSLNLPTAYALTAFWGGASGSLLLWALLLAAVTAAFVAFNRRRRVMFASVATGALAFVLLGLVLALAINVSPFAKFEGVTSDGRGLLPQLQQPLMALHPPLLYLGIAATTVPFALTVGALVARQLDEMWLASVRRWTLFAWTVLSIGLLIGMRWAYLEEGWGGFWAWDAVQNAALMPWLTCTAVLHVCLQHRPTSALRQTVVWLTLATFVLSLAGAYIARSGAVSTMHSFVSVGAGAQPTGAQWIFNLLLVVLAACAALRYGRRDCFRVVTDAPVAHEPLTRWAFNRDTVLRAGVMTLMAIVITTFWGTVFPLISEVVKRGPATLGSGYFNGVSRPLAVLLLVLMALGSFARTNNAADSATLRVTPRRIAALTAHLGVIAMMVAIAGSMFARQTVGAIKTGDVVSAQDAFGARWTFTSQGMSTYEEINRQVLGVSAAVAKNGRSSGMLMSEQRQFLNANGDDIFDPTTKQGLRTTALQDIAFVFTGSPERDVATVRITFTPFAVWLWIGGALIVTAGLMLFWPSTPRDA